MFFMFFARRKFVIVFLLLFCFSMGGISETPVRAISSCNRNEVSDKWADDDFVFP